MSEKRQAWFGIRWLHAVRTHPARTRHALIAANALFPYMHNITGQAIVSLERMADDQRQGVKPLRRGFGELEAIGLLSREKQRKPDSQEWDTTIYHPRLADSPANTQGTKAADGDRPNNYAMSSEVKRGSKRPLDSEKTDEEKRAKATQRTNSPGGDPPPHSSESSEVKVEEGSKQPLRDLTEAETLAALKLADELERTLAIYEKEMRDQATGER